MTEQNAIILVQNTTDELAGELPAEALEEAFVALYGRYPNDEDREDGVWSLCCAVVAELTEDEHD